MFIVLSTSPFHGVIWVLLSLGIVGNVLVVVWRLTQKRDQRSSPLSILIIVLAVSDFFYCVHLILLETLVAFVNLDETQNFSQIFSRSMCMTSALLSWLSCSTAQWTIFNIAVYSFQALTECCSRCCCSLVRKGNLVIAIIFQGLLNVFVIMFMLDSSGMSGLNGNEVFNVHLGYRYDNLPSSNSDFDYWCVRSTYVIYSRRERITAIFGQCAWAQSSGYGYCINRTDSTTVGNYPKIYNSSCCDTDNNYYVALGTFTASQSAVLTLSCVVLYLLVCLKVRRLPSQTGRSDTQNLQWRLSVIVVLNTLCWIPIAVLHWMIAFTDVYSTGGTSVDWTNDSTAASVLLISISPAVNPLIYTLTGKNFLHSIREFCRRMKCHISVRQNSSNYYDDHIRGVERCSCIPCIRCVHQDDVDWNTEETSAWNSDQSRQLLSIDESSETV